LAGAPCADGDQSAFSVVIFRAVNPVPCRRAPSRLEMAKRPTVVPVRASAAASALTAGWGRLELVIHAHARSAMD